MDSLFKNSSNFSSLSLADLIEARDLFHYHLMNKKNVVATALGLYRIRKTDKWPSEHDTGTAPRGSKGRRTLFNSEVRQYSWPCVYAFVSSWEEEQRLLQADPSDVVPPALFLPDGRSVPVCLIEARLQNIAQDLEITPNSFSPRNYFGPGCAILNEDGQGMARLATAGCIVRDGQRFYVMTNRHAIGEKGTSIKALKPHRTSEIGITSEKGLTRVDFQEIYPNFQSTKQRLLMDVGLVDIDNILDWKTEFAGIAPVEPVLDLYDNSLSLKLIQMKVVGLSAVSGLIRGEIHGLFYRYKALGGSEYISDFLIGPETHGNVPDKEKKKKLEEDNKEVNIGLSVHHGDSGTVLFIERTPEKPNEKPVYYPFALLWGKEEFFAGNEPFAPPFALATSLSTALDQLDLDLVRNINMDQEYVWGWVGHYTIGRSLNLPADLVTSTKLQSFIKKNLDLLALQPDDVLGNNAKVIQKGSSKINFVPLADVPDNVWKSNVNLVIGTDGKKHPGPGARGQNDNPNHFADLDLEYKNNKTFLRLNFTDPDTYLNPKAWIQYFADLEPKFAHWYSLMHPPGTDPDKRGGDHNNHWGALPFRVHQLFDTMVKAAKDGDQELFLCAGGVLIHYVGDACQPLHASYLSQGDPDRVVKRPKANKMRLEADGVHSGYEDDMIAYGYQEENLGKKLSTEIGALKKEKILDIKNGYDASKAIIALVQATQTEIPPREIVNKWVELDETKNKPAAMWKTFGDRTVTCMARGTRYLAKIWQAAWEAGNGDGNIGVGKVATPDALIKLYNDPDKMPSVALDKYPDDPNSDWSSIKRPPPASHP
jgi:hypothetical protein